MIRALLSLQSTSGLKSLDKLQLLATGELFTNQLNRDLLGCCFLSRKHVTSYWCESPNSEPPSARRPNCNRGRDYRQADRECSPCNCWAHHRHRDRIRLDQLLTHLILLLRDRLGCCFDCCICSMAQIPSVGQAST